MRTSGGRQKKSRIVPKETPKGLEYSTPLKTSSAPKGLRLEASVVYSLVGAFARRKLGRSRKVEKLQKGTGFSLPP
jgi:hypothetical protein